MAQPSPHSTNPAVRSTSKPKREPAKKAQRASAADTAVNAIEFGAERPRGAETGGALGVPQSAKAEREARGKKGSQRRDEARATPSILESRSEPIPDTVRERFIQIGNNFFFPDGAEAFTDHGNRVTTRSENAVVIQSMVAIAQTRAAAAVTVTGTELFKKEAWFASRLAGLQVSGYEPTALEQERLVRALARRRTAEREEAAAASRPQGSEQGERPRQEASSPAARERPAQEADLIVGRLVDHGVAPYQHKPTQSMSYYVRIETERGDREIWGVDLERAFRQSLSTPGIGDEVGVRAIGRDAVTVRAPKYDAEGREVGREELDTHRNQWIVERKDFLERRQKMADLLRNAAVSAADGVKQYPELEGSYLQLQIARAGTEQRIGSAQAREQFVEYLRAHLAKTVEYGQALEPVPLKARSEPTPEPEKVQDRDYQPTR